MRRSPCFFLNGQILVIPALEINMKLNSSFLLDKTRVAFMISKTVVSPNGYDSINNNR